MAKHPQYMGCKGVARPEELKAYDKAGKHVAEVKMDGIWAYCEIEAGQNNFTSRNSLVQNGDDALIQGLRNLKLPAEWVGTKLAGELETQTQEAVESAKRLGYKRFFVFDIVQFKDEDVRRWKLIDRRQLLETMWKLLDEQTGKRMPLVKQWQQGFEAEYRKVVAAGGEGLVLKQKDMPYEPRNADGKVDHWIKVKKLVTQDMVVMGLGFGDKTGDLTSLRCGLFVKGKLTEICRIGLNHDLWVARNSVKWDKWIGAVVEVEGFEIFRSGAVRSGGVKRLRNDKPPEECVLEDLEVRAA